MGNCCCSFPSGNLCYLPSLSIISSSISDEDDPYHSHRRRCCSSLSDPSSLPEIVIRDHWRSDGDLRRKYDIGCELGRGEFGVTRRCWDLETGGTFACKSISKRKLRSTADVNDVQREVEITRTLPAHPNVVWLRDVFEDRQTVHLVMELGEGGELFDRIVARGHYTERAAAAVMKTIMEVIQADIDGNGTLDCEEFVTVSVHLKKIRSEEHLPKAFNYFDKDGSGYIEIDDLREALADDNLGLNEQVVFEIISDVDIDKDGRISYQEFEIMMRPEME